MRAHSMRVACVCINVRTRVYDICAHINIACGVLVNVRMHARVYGHACTSPARVACVCVRLHACVRVCVHKCR